MKGTLTLRITKSALAGDWPFKLNLSPRRRGFHADVRFVSTRENQGSQYTYQGNVHRGVGKVPFMPSLRQPATIARAALVVSALVGAFFMVGPFQGLEEALVPWDKAAHFIAFYTVTALLLVGFPGRRRIDLAAIAVLGGAAIEVAQQLAGRDAGLGDLAANAAGASAVLAPIWIERLRGPPRLERRRSPAWLRRRPRPFPVQLEATEPDQKGLSSRA